MKAARSAAQVGMEADEGVEATRVGAVGGPVGTEAPEARGLTGAVVAGSVEAEVRE